MGDPIESDKPEPTRQYPFVQAQVPAGFSPKDSLTVGQWHCSKCGYLPQEMVKVKSKGKKVTHSCKLCGSQVEWQKGVAIR